MSNKRPHENQRNYYRILHVQPDAPASVIKTNYRTTQQKMRAHPDLGGDHWNSALINEAYATLRNPARRRSYDLDLLQRYDISLLSMGGKATSGAADKQAGTGKPGLGEKNQRNYYRILQVQHDAPQAIIEASFRTLAAAAGKDSKLVHEAFAVIKNPTWRNAYDDLLDHYHHDEAVRRLHAPPEPSRRSGRAEPGHSKKPTSPDPGQGATITIAHYCPFCKTPASTVRTGPGDPDWCVECHSPLPPASPAPTAFPGVGPAVGPAAGRDAMRLEGGSQIWLFNYWPSAPTAAVVQNVSATGASIVTANPVDPSTTLKLDSEHFCAIARVIRCAAVAPGAWIASEIGGYEIGLSFLSARFVRPGGNFLNVTA